MFWEEICSTIKFGYNEINEENIFMYTKKESVWELGNTILIELIFQTSNLYLI